MMGAQAPTLFGWDTDHTDNLEGLATGTKETTPSSRN